MNRSMKKQKGTLTEDQEFKKTDQKKDVLTLKSYSITSISTTGGARSQ